MTKRLLASSAFIAIAAALTVAPGFAQAPAPATPAPAMSAPAAPAAAAPAAATPTTGAKTHATRTERVERLQSALNANGAKLTVDGKMGPKTHAALMDFQKAHGLKATGKPDKDTIAALKTTG